MIRTLSIVAIIALLTFGCVAPTSIQASQEPQEFPAGEPQSLQPLRIIIKLRDSQVQVSDPTFLANLSKTAGETLSYVHPVWGDAHVLLANKPLSPEQRQEILRRLSSRADVLSAEEDITMQVQ